MKSLLFFVLIVLISLACGLKTANFCKLRQEKCTGYYNQHNSYEEACVKLACRDISGYDQQCGRLHCSVDKKTCFKLLTAMDLFKKLNKTNESQTKNYRFQKFIDSFAGCPLLRYELKPTDVCTKSRGCFHSINRGNTWNKLMKSVVCPCGGKHSYQCGDEFCTVDNIACNSLMSMDAGLAKFKKC